MRKLATIQTIRELHPIPNADTIEVASILGWKVVVKKGEFQVGDKVVYIEIDAILPDRPEFEFLRDRKFRVRTVRLRGQVSQGICFPLSLLKAWWVRPLVIVKEGDDVTEAVGIEQWLPQIPANIAGEVKGPFPHFIPKTDETRVQILQPLISRYKGELCYVTEKLDGSSVTYYYRDGEFGVCSRNLELKETEDNLFWKMARKLKIEEKLKLFGHNVAIQGELFGLGIQKNNLRLDEPKVAFFNLFYIDTYKYADYSQFYIELEGMGLETVPILQIGYELTDNIDELVEKAKGFSAFNPKVYREGIVIRPLKELIDLQMSNEWGNGRVTFKVINPDYLLKFEE